MKIYGTAVAFHIKDWLKENRHNHGYTENDVEACIKDSDVLAACRDLCNSGKHFRIDRYSPKTQDVYSSAGASTVIKILMFDNEKYEAVDMADQAIAAWESFFKTHGIN